MKRVLLHIGVAVLCTAIGVSIWLYVNNLIFPAKPVPFELEEQLLKSSDILETAEMVEDFAYLVETIEAVHPDPYKYIGEDTWKEKKDALLGMFETPLSAAEYYFALNSLVTSVQDAHTILLFEETDRGLPLKFEWIEEGLFITEDCGYFRKGDLILMIGDRNPQEILNTLVEITPSENIYRVKDESRRNLRRRPVLEFLGLVQDDTVRFTVDRDGQIFEITSQFEAELPGLKQRSEELLAHRQYWYMDQENNLGLFRLRVCINDDVFKQDVEDFFCCSEEQRN